MTYVVTQACCNDASCMSVCPVNCIHPTPGEPDFGRTEMVYVDPGSCIDCGACADACPVSAIKPLDLLRGDEQVFVDLNASYYADRDPEPAWAAPTFPATTSAGAQPLRVAVVGTGPAASYAARQVLLTSSAEVSMIDRLPVVGGLVRAGVAPDHQDTKRLTDIFTWTYEHPRTRMYLNVEVGRDVSHADLLAHHDAVIYGVGARTDRTLDVPGEDLVGVHGAPEVVGWYNSHPDVPADAVRLTGDRALVIGNGNVALDIARILLADPDRLAETDIADHTLAALRDNPVREVVLVGRRGPAAAAFTRPELLMMPGEIDVVVAADPQVCAEVDQAPAGSKARLLAGLPQIDTSWDSPPPEGRRVVLAFHRRVEQISGAGAAESVRLGHTGDPGIAPVAVPAGMVVRSTGHRGLPVPGLPFDETTATIPHESGRVVDPATGAAVPGAYVVGWIKRGAYGGIGANRADAVETVATLLGDELESAGSSARGFERTLRRRGLDVVDARRARRIDAAERGRGVGTDRPRVKFATVEEMLARHRVRA